MAIEIRVPRLGWSMEEGAFAGWLKPEGDLVRPGDLLFALEGDKATQEIESLDGGILKYAAPAPSAGDTVRVGQLLGYLVAENARTGSIEAEQAPAGDLARPEPADAPRAATEPVREPSQPRMPRRTETDAAISPRAARAARQLGVDWRALRVRGTGRGGRIRERDIRAAAGPRAASAIAAGGASAEEDRTPMTPIRKVIADRMLAAVRNAALVTLHRRVEASRFREWREELKAEASRRRRAEPTFTDLLLKAAALALAEHPEMNSRREGDFLVRPRGIHLGIAVDAAAGLLVPVLRDAGSLSVGEIADRSRGLIDRARTGKLTAGEMAGGTFTLTNLGGLGIDEFTPIPNYPECGILGAGRLIRGPVVKGGALAVGETLSLSLTFDHCVVDGAPAARFLRTVACLIEAPEEKLVY